jgi:hypothetical protein
MSAFGAGAEPAHVDLYWIPLGAGGWFVKQNGRLYEAVTALHERRRPLDLYHCALEVAVPEGRFVIEQTPVSRGPAADRGAVAAGPVGTRAAGALRIFRYEVRRWRDGIVPDIAEAVDSPRRVSTDVAVARRLLELVPAVPTLVWGRDELGTGQMWNSNAVVSWLITRAGLDPTGVRPPAGGRALGWDAGIVAARRGVTGPGMPAPPPAGGHDAALTLAARSGLAAVAVYVSATILGGRLHPGYSHIRDSISELTASHAVDRVLLAALFVAYNALLAVFAWGCWRAAPRLRTLRNAFGLIVVTAASGIAQVTTFPQDSSGTPATTAGAAHIALAGLSAFGCVVTAVMYGVAFRRLRLRRSSWVPCFAVAGFLLLVGPLAAVNVGGPLMGLYERLTIGAYLAWVALTCAALVRERGHLTAVPGIARTSGPAERPSGRGPSALVPAPDGS